jgi:hypothetical protein
MLSHSAVVPPVSTPAVVPILLLHLQCGIPGGNAVINLNLLLYPAVDTCYCATVLLHTVMMQCGIPGGNAVINLNLQDVVFNQKIMAGSIVGGRADMQVGPAAAPCSIKKQHAVVAACAARALPLFVFVGRRADVQLGSGAAPCSIMQHHAMVAACATVLFVFVCP